MSWPLIKIAAGPVPAKISVPLAKSQSFVNLSLIGITNGSYAGGAGYGIPITAANAPYTAYAIGEFASGQGGVNGAFTSNQAAIYQPVATPGGTDGLVSANVATGAALLLPDTSAPTGYTNCSIATNGQRVYTTDGQSGVCFLGPGGPAAALTAGYVFAGIQTEFNADGDGNIAVFCQPWLNSQETLLVSGVIAATAAASSIALAGAQVGDQVIQALDVTAGGTDVRAGAFETVISVAGQIQQTGAGFGSGVTLSDNVAIILQRG